MPAVKQYINLFDQERDTIYACSADVMNVHRAEAYETFRSHGLPSRREERYRYIDLQSMFAPDYGLNLRRRPFEGNPYEMFRCYVPGLKSALYFVVNDMVYAPSGHDKMTEEGVTVDSFKNFEQCHPDILRHYYNSLASHDDALCAFNTMLAQDGLVVYVEKGVDVARPIQVVNMLHSSVDMMTNRRVLVVVGDHATLNLLFCDHAESNVNFLSTQVVEVFVGKGATLDMTYIEETHRKNNLVSSTLIRQEAQSHLTHNAITLHNGTTRNNLCVVLDGEGAECSLHGAVIIDKQQMVDSNTLIRHASPATTSDELYKYVLGDASHGAFAGKILVCREAQKTNAQMRNQNLCATREARMQTQPMLEIYADDVKCSHGATVGQLDDAALFYMQQRGIPLSEAKRLLQIAFVREVIDTIQLPALRDRLQYLTEKRFRGELSKCEGCSLCL